MNPKPIPTPGEMEILKLVWQGAGDGPGQSVTVRYVYEEIRKKRRTAYTTIMTLMRIMESKGLIQKNHAIQDRAYHYDPVDSAGDLRRRLVDEFVERVFDGDKDELKRLLN